MKFAKRVFTGAGIYGLIVMTPMYFLEPAMNAAGQPLTHPEMLYGFVGVTLAFQVVFLILGRDPVRFRPMIIPSLIEKVSFGAAVWPLFLMGRTPGVVAFFATIDLFLAALFLMAWFRTKPA
jgi:hypothetical protein